ncbi:MAG: EamA family transporter [Alphaproteobacteria bacterium]|nr:EamA family transporter [Alphaproteobacteria bacterium]TAD90302.1 MAG: EamA family transporter [Alphaproteobacteria bacterium]
MSLDPVAITLILTAALMHATWHAMVKSVRDPILSMGQALAWAGAVGLILAVRAGWPPAAVWPWLGASLAIQLVYLTVLTRAYAVGDLSLAYPLARGLGPVVVAVLSALWVGEGISRGMIAGLGLVAVGVGVMAITGRLNTIPWRTIALALACALLIGCYTVVDGIGTRLWGDAVGYVGWIYLLTSPWLLGWAAIRRGARVWQEVAPQWRRGVIAGILSVAAYGVALWAITTGPMAAVAALREVSVVFAAVIGAVVLREPFGVRRVLGAALVVCGLFVITLTS